MEKSGCLSDEPTGFFPRLLMWLTDVNDSDNREFFSEPSTIVWCLAAAFADVKSIEIIHIAN